MKQPTHCGLIASLTGQVVETTEDFLVVETTGGVGYGVRVTRRCLEASRERDPFTVLIHDHITETRRDLYGFESSGERDLFRVLIAVKGIGPMIAVRALSSQSWKDIAMAVASNNGDRLRAMKIRGVGPKAMQAILAECRQSCSDLLDHYQQQGGLGVLGVDVAASPSTHEDAVSALVNMGFDEATVRRELRQRDAASAPGATVESIVKDVLPSLNFRRTRCPG